MILRQVQGSDIKPSAAAGNFPDTKGFPAARRPENGK